MSGANSFKFVLLPPQSDTTRDWAKRLAEIVPEARVILAEDADTAAREIVDAEAAFGWLGSDLLLKATKLRWLQAPQAAPPAGYYYPALIAHSVVVTNFRERRPNRSCGGIDPGPDECGAGRVQGRVTPSRIARQFGLSHSAVRKALSSAEPKR